MKKNYQGLQTAILIIVILFSFCASKQTTSPAPPSDISSAQSAAWHGRYADIATLEQPKEDFKVNDYIIVAYAPCEEDEDSDELYKFALTLDGKQIGLIFLKKLFRDGYLICHNYFQENSDLVETISKSVTFENDRYITYEIYRDRPDYKALKYKAITAVTGTHALTYTQSIGNDDSVKIILFPDGTWEHLFSSDSDYVMTIALPNVIEVEGDQKIQLTKNGTWDFLHPDSLKQKNVYRTISLERSVVDVEVVPYDMVEKKPRPIFSPVPKYPELAKYAGVEGMAVVKSLIDIDGSVMIAKILKSSRCSHLDLAALKCDMKARFEPAMQGDKVVRVWVSRPYKFKLQ
ncbi:MAG: energy transducer TonB [bacterium]